MMKRIVVLLLILQIGGAFTIQSYNVTFFLESSGPSKQVVETVFTPDEPMQTLPFQMPGSTEIVNISCNPACSLSTTNQEATISFEDELAANQSTRVMMEYKVPKATIDEPENKLFIHTFRPDSPINYFQLKLVLPMRAVLADTPDPINTPTIFPNAQVTSDGKRILIIWSIENTRLNSEHVFLTRYIDAPSSSSISLVAIGIILLMIIGAVIYFRKSATVAPSKPEPLPVPSSVPTQPLSQEKLSAVLSPDENRALELIRSSPGIQQNKLVRILGFNKVKASRVLTKLENSGLVRKERAGITNELYMK